MDDLSNLTDALPMYSGCDELLSQLEWYKDEWQLMSDELDQALDDLQEEQTVHRLTQDELFILKLKLKDFQEDATIQNRAITERAVALSNLIDEYDRIFDHYVSLTDTKLITNHINNLRKHGGYPPL